MAIPMKVYSDSLTKCFLGGIGPACLFLFQMAVVGQAVYSRPCFPSDPEGDNSGNLCLAYPTHGMSIDSNSFRQGFASEGYYGNPVGPRFPGSPIEPNHIPGTPMDLRGRSPGYWTKIETTNGQSRVETNTGREWLMQSK